MKTPDNTRVGYLLSSDGDRIATVRTGKITSIQHLKGSVVLNRYDGFRILFVLDRMAPHQKVSIAGKHQAGAILLKPGESICLQHDGIESTFRFEILPEVQVITEEDEVCEFCRTPFGDHPGQFCHTTRLQGNAAGVVLCSGCANSWKR